MPECKAQSPSPLSVLRVCGARSWELGVGSLEPQELANLIYEPSDLCDDYRPTKRNALLASGGGT